MKKLIYVLIIGIGIFLSNCDNYKYKIRQDEAVYFTNSYTKSNGCVTEFFYNDSDVKSDFRDGDYVICPVCGKFLFHGEPSKSVDRSKDC